MDNELTPSPDQTMPQGAMPQEAKPPTVGRSRRVRLFRYGLFILLCLLIIPAVVLPFWLASKGIVINAISGISVGKKIVINELSIAINRTTITMKDLTLEHFSDEESAISDASWRLSSPKVDIRLSPELHNVLRQQDLSLGIITFTDIAFNLTDLSPPYVFSAHTRQAEVSFSRREGPPFTQQIDDLDLVLTTEPYVTVTGVAHHAEFILFLPQDIHTTPYPLSVTQTQFSVSWQGTRTPLAVHIADIQPQWPTINPRVQQSGKDITLIMDLSQPTTTIKLTGDSLVLDQPLHLPEFIDKPDDTHQGLHLGQAIASLAQLPFRKLRIRSLTYGTLLIQSKVVLETPLFRMNKPNKHAKFHLKGKALGPDPYDINVLIKHKGTADAHLSATLTGHHGNTLACHAQINLSSPLPETLICDANIKQTQTLANRLNLPDLPHAVLNKPIVITATQTSLSLADSNPAHQIKQFQHVDKASYNITVSLPEIIDVNLPPTNTPISSLTLQTDGSLSVIAKYDNGLITVSLAPKQERLRINSTQLGAELSVALSDTLCVIPVFATSPATPTPASKQDPLSKLHCHAKSQLQAKLKALNPTPVASADNITLQTDLDIDWSDRVLNLVLSNNALGIDQLNLALGESWREAQAHDLSLQASRILITQAFKPDTDQRLKISAPNASAITLHGKLSAQQVITATSPKPQHLKKRKHPVQRYAGRFALTLSDLAFTALPAKLKADYHLELNLSQNKQHLPALQSKGQLTLNDSLLGLYGTLLNAKLTELLLFSVDYNIAQSQADVRLHRNEINFSATQSLKKHYLPNLPIQYDLYTGSISLESRIKYTDNQWHGNIALFTHNLGGYMHNMHFADLNMSITTAFTPDGIRSIHPISLHAGYLNAGVLLENLFAVLEFDTRTPLYRLQRASAYLMGGSISVHDVRTSRLTDIPTTPLLVYGIKLDKLIDTIDIKDIVMTGTLDGTLPLAVADGSPVVENGILQARYPGGVLKYKEGSTIDQNIEAAGNNSLLVISKILKNYHYNTLAIDLNYSNSGQMSARSAFKGHNPDILSGRQLNLNLSIQENIPALLKTLSVINSSKLEDIFLKQMGVDE